jgi:hypothetical protein
VNDRLAEPTTALTRYRALDFSFDVDVSATSQQLIEHVAWLLGDLESDGAACHRYRLALRQDDPRRRVLLTRDHEPIGYPWDAPDTLGRLVADITAQAVASRPDHLALHAAALAIDGQGLLLPGPPSAGKTTLAAALVTAGFDYLTDEAAVIDVDTLDVAPFPKPLSLGPGSLAALGRPHDPSAPAETQTLLPASALRCAAPGRAVPARFLVFPGYQPGAVSTLITMSRAEAMVELANNSFNFMTHGRKWLGLLHRLVSACTCVRLVTGDLDAARNLLLALVSRTGGTVG